MRETSLARVTMLVTESVSAVVLLRVGSNTAMEYSFVIGKIFIYAVYWPNKS
jgi:hypothetical protein